MILYIDGVEKLSQDVNQHITSGFYDKLEIGKRTTNGYVRKVKYYQLPRGATLHAHRTIDCNYNEYYDSSTQSCIASNYIS